jgi:hypothetical protein
MTDPTPAIIPSEVPAWHVSRRRKSTLVARIELEGRVAEPSHEALLVSPPTTGIRFISSLRNSKAAQVASQSADGVLMDTIAYQSATKAEAPVRPRRGSIVVLSVVQDSTEQSQQQVDLQSTEGSNAQADQVKSMSVIAGIKFLRSKKRSSFRIGYDYVERNPF